MKTAEEMAYELTKGEGYCPDGGCLDYYCQGVCSMDYEKYAARIARSHRAYAAQVLYEAWAAHTNATLAEDVQRIMTRERELAEVK